MRSPDSSRTHVRTTVQPRLLRPLASRDPGRNHPGVRPDQLLCEECEALSGARAEGWRGHLVDLDDDGEDEVVFYCLRCATREFGKKLRPESRRPPLL
jgi:hypothetical protein